MKTTTPQTKVNKLSKAKIFWISLAGILLVAIAIPLLMGDGTQKYSGAEKEAAIEALNHDRMANRGIDGLDRIGAVLVRVESVEPTSNQTPANRCNTDFVVPAHKQPPYRETARFWVTLRVYTFFGISVDTYDLGVCQLE